MSADARELEHLVSVDAETWAQETARSLRNERRAAAGGWPGTLSEARLRVFQVLALASAGQLPIEAHERLARLSYAAARKHWANQAEAEPDM